MRNWINQPSNRITLLLFCLFINRLILLPRLNLENGQQIRVSGTVSQSPQVSSKSQIIQLGQVKIITSRYPEFVIGDRLSVVGKTQINSVSQFKFVNQLFQDTVLVYPKISKIGYQAPVGFLGFTDKIKKRFLVVFSGLPSPLDGLAAGITLGDKSLLLSKTKDQLINTGTYHLAVASGMNVIYLAQGLLGLINWRINRRKALIVAILLVWLYVFIAGLTAPLVRAALMLSLVYLSQISGRLAVSRRVLIMTGLVMLVVQPELLFSVSFQLSFMATAGLVYLQPVIKKVRLLRNEAISGTLAAQIMTLPIITAVFSQYNIISPIVNLSVVLLIPFVLGGGLIFGLIGLLFLDLGIKLTYLLFPPLFVISQIVSWFANLTVFQVQNVSFPWWLWLGYYGMMGTLINKRMNNNKPISE